MEPTVQDELVVQLATLSPAVLVWVAWMMFCFLASVLFVRSHRPARFTLLAFVLTMILGTAIFAMSSNIHLLGIAHLIVWIPLATYLLQREIRTEPFEFGSAYGIWTGLLMTTIVVSLLFDVRDIVLVMMGVK